MSSIFELKLNQKIDSISISLVVVSLISLSWKESLNYQVIQLILTLFALVMVFFTYSNKDIIFSKRSNSIFFMSSMFFFSFSTAIFTDSSKAFTISRVSSRILSDLLIFLPLVIMFVIIINNSKPENKRFPEIMYYIGLGSIVISLIVSNTIHSSSVINSHAIILTLFMVPLVFMTTMEKNIILTAIYTSMLFLISFYAGATIERVNNQIIWEIPPGIIFTYGICILLIYLMLKLEINDQFNESHHSIAIITMIALVLAALGINDYVFVQTNSTLQSTLTANLMTTTGLGISLYGTKTARKYYNWAGQGVIFVTLLRGLLVLGLRATSADPGEQNLLFAALTLLYGGLAIFIELGARSVAKREGVDDFLTRLLKPKVRKSDE